MASITDLRAKSVDELNDRLVELKKEQFNLRFQKASGQLENTARVTAIRKEVAQVKTVLNEQRRTSGAA